MPTNPSSPSSFPPFPDHTVAKQIGMLLKYWRDGQIRTAEPAPQVSSHPYLPKQEPILFNPLRAEYLHQNPNVGIL
jgi:hypothetical protein